MTEKYFNRKAQQLPADNPTLTRAFWFWLYTVKTRAIDLRTTLIFASFDAAPPVTLLTRSWASSFLRSSNLFKRASLFSWRSSWALSFPYKPGKSSRHARRTRNKRNIREKWERNKEYKEINKVERRHLPMNISL